MNLYIIKDISFNFVIKIPYKISYIGYKISYLIYQISDIVYKIFDF